MLTAGIGATAVAPEHVSLMGPGSAAAAAAYAAVGNHHVGWLTADAGAAAGDGASTAGGGAGRAENALQQFAAAVDLEATPGAVECPGDQVGRINKPFKLVAR